MQNFYCLILNRIVKCFRKPVPQYVSLFLIIIQINTFYGLIDIYISYSFFLFIFLYMCIESPMQNKLWDWKHSTLNYEQTVLKQINIIALELLKIILHWIITCNSYDYTHSHKLITFLILNGILCFKYYTSLKSNSRSIYLDVWLNILLYLKNYIHIYHILIKQI